MHDQRSRLKSERREDMKKLVLELSVSTISSITGRIRPKSTLALNTSVALLKSSRVTAVIKQLG